MALPSVIQLNEFSSGEFFELETRGPGVYRQVCEIKGNSVLSSVFIEEINPGASLQVNYFDTTTGASFGERFDLSSHKLIDGLTPNLSTFRILVTKIHHRVVAEAIVVGGSVKFSVYATVVSSTASDIDENLVGNLDPLDTSRGLIAAGYDPITNITRFIPVTENGIKVDGLIDLEFPAGGVDSYPKGLRYGGRVTEVTLNNASWVPLPTTPLSNRNAIAIQNYSGSAIRLNYSPFVSGLTGVLVPDGIERQYNISDQIIIYAKSEAPLAVVTIEEIS